MGDGAEGLVDAEARIQDRIGELEQRRTPPARRATDPERERRLESLRLARSELRRQAEVTGHPIRREQIMGALAEVERRIAELTATPA